MRRAFKTPSVAGRESALRLIIETDLGSDFHISCESEHGTFPVKGR